MNSAYTQSVGWAICRLLNWIKRFLNCDRSRSSVIAYNEGYVPHGFCQMFSFQETAKNALTLTQAFFYRSMLGNCQRGKANTLLRLPNDALHIEFAGRNSEFNFTVAEWSSNKRHMITRCKPVMNSPIEVFMTNCNIKIEYQNKIFNVSIKY